MSAANLIDPLTISFLLLACALFHLWRKHPDARKSLRWPVANLSIRGGPSDLGALQPVLADVLLAGHVQAHSLGDGAPPEGERFEVRVELAESSEG